LGLGITKLRGAWLNLTKGRERNEGERERRIAQLGYGQRRQKKSKLGHGSTKLKV